MKNFKWQITILAFTLTLALAVGGVYLRQRQLVDEPLLKRLNEYEGVKTVELRQQGNMQIVVISLEYVDLHTVHKELNDEIGRLLGHKRYTMELVDLRDDTLQAAFVAVHLALYESEQRGNFAEMGEKVDEILSGLGLDDYRLVVDPEYIYLQIRNGEQYLYEIIERNQRGGEGERV